MKHLNQRVSSSASSIEDSSNDESFLMTAEQFFNWEKSSRDSIEVKRCYVDMADDLVAGVMLSQIVYWHLPDRQGNTKLRVHKNGNYWIAKKYSDWWNECRIKQRSAERKIDLLKKKNLVTTNTFKFNGVPTLHIALNWPVFLRELALVINQQADKRPSHEESYQTNSSKQGPIPPSCHSPVRHIGEVNPANMAQSLTETTTNTNKDREGKVPQHESLPPYTPSVNVQMKDDVSTHTGNTAMFDAVCEVSGRDPARLTTNIRKRIARVVKQLRDFGVTDALEVHKWGQLWMERDWRGQNGQVPEIEQIVGDWDRVRSLRKPKTFQTIAEQRSQEILRRSMEKLNKADALSNSNFSSNPDSNERIWEGRIVDE